jgi:hypothetical protein
MTPYQELPTITPNPCSGTCGKAREEWITGFLSTPGGEIPVVTDELSPKDITGRWKSRWGIGRMRYSVAPGLYAIGKPDASSPVFASANYKMSFDCLRRDLRGLNGWILVLDTKGINVWCAAGKGIFSTDELAHRIRLSNLMQIVDHKNIIVPQLGAPGVAAYRIKKETGFSVKYGPVLSRDIAAYIKNGLTASGRMRRVPFGIKERTVLIPMELIPAMKSIPYIFIFLVVLQLAIYRAFTLESLLLMIPFLGAIMAGCVVFQLMLPWIPFRSFVIKGWILGLLWSVLVHLWTPAANWNPAGWYFLLPPLTAFLAENFTGSTTFTHLSGVKRELRLGLPVMAVSLLVGVILQFF